MIQIEELLEKIIAWQDVDNIELLDFVLYSNSLSDLESVVSLRNRINAVLQIKKKRNTSFGIDNSVLYIRYLKQKYPKAYPRFPEIIFQKKLHHEIQKVGENNSFELSQMHRYNLGRPLNRQWGDDEQSQLLNCFEITNLDFFENVINNMENDPHFSAVTCRNRITAWLLCQRHFLHQFPFHSIDDYLQSLYSVLDIEIFMKWLRSEIEEFGDRALSLSN